MEKKIAVIGIVLDEIDKSEKVNSILHEFNKIIIGRMGLPYREKNISVISVAVNATIDEISSLTGKLGQIKGVSVKAAISKH
ncbi:MAG: CopG family transcriptional regulator [Clostridiales bacterium]|jgi:putative iron-only hydrogenase system regulator|nr:CopG family transcriptional regulator [Clostridiales bacterium]